MILKPGCEISIQLIHSENDKGTQKKILRKNFYYCYFSSVKRAFKYFSYEIN